MQKEEVHPSINSLGQKHTILESNTSWDNYFVTMLPHIASKSKDPSTKVGAIIVDSENRIQTTGYNGFPSGVIDYETRYYNRETKYKFIIHAEANAIYESAKSGKSIRGCKLYVSWHPCENCAKAIIASGIKEVIFYQDPPSRWNDSIDIAQAMFDESGVSVRRV